MNTNLENQALAQLDESLTLYKDIYRAKKYSDFSNVSESEVNCLITGGLQAIERFAGPASRYLKHIDALTAKLLLQSVRNFIGRFLG